MLNQLQKILTGILTENLTVKLLRFSYLLATLVYGLSNVWCSPPANQTIKINWLGSFWTPSCRSFSHGMALDSDTHAQAKAGRVPPSECSEIGRDTPRTTAKIKAAVQLLWPQNSLGKPPKTVQEKWANSAAFNGEYICIIHIQKQDISEHALLP